MTRLSGSILSIVALALVLAGCRTETGVPPNAASAGNDEAITVEPRADVTLSSDSTSDATMESTYGLTYQQQDGNRFIDGQGQLPGIKPVDVPLGGTPIWLVAAPLDKGIIWVAILEDGRVEAFHVEGESVESIAIEPSQLPAGMPPLLIVDEGGPNLLTGAELEASELTHPIKLTSSIESIAAITRAGDLAIEQNGETMRLAVNALPDARLLMDESGRLLMLSDPTTRYGHGVLGDDVEAASVTLVETGQSPHVALRLEIDSGKVIEGIAPIWADLDGDGAREIIVTESDAESGARIVAYDEQGRQVAAGPTIGTGYRWRHQLAVAPFGPSGEVELASVLTPHIGGIVEFFRMNGDELEIVARVPGYSSHMLGSRNLDRAIAGDLDGDGLVELLVPNQSQESLGAIRRTNDGAEMVWSIPIGGRLSTNLAAVALSNGDLALGAGREDGVLRVWLPPDSGPKE